MIQTEGPGYTGVKLILHPQKKGGRKPKRRIKKNVNRVPGRQRAEEVFGKPEEGAEAG